MVVSFIYQTLFAILFTVLIMLRVYNIIDDVTIERALLIFVILVLMRILRVVEDMNASLYKKL